MPLVTLLTTTSAASNPHLILGDLPDWYDKVAHDKTGWISLPSAGSATNALENVARTKWTVDLTGMKILQLAENKSEYNIIHTWDGSLSMILDTGNVEIPRLPGPDSAPIGAYCSFLDKELMDHLIPALDLIPDDAVEENYPILVGGISKNALALKGIICRFEFSGNREDGSAAVFVHSIKGEDVITEPLGLFDKPSRKEYKGSMFQTRERIRGLKSGIWGAVSPSNFNAYSHTNGDHLA